MDTNKDKEEEEILETYPLLERTLERSFDLASQILIMATQINSKDSLLALEATRCTI
ncbi:uncharacterized protein FTOL_13021 [Fusarium torulosum]|uniref:Uncharacterized protein n=1 Tax=Fusarium torulosum TaxID=33205 RepID=A0AAE8SPF8_9HYPO|nr:uncharacterized protein FTOL_13021 [Fusarium torulosum]